MLRFGLLIKLAWAILPAVALANPAVAADDSGQITAVDPRKIWPSMKSLRKKTLSLPISNIHATIPGTLVLGPPSDGTNETTMIDSRIYFPKPADQVYFEINGEINDDYYLTWEILFSAPNSRKSEIGDYECYLSPARFCPMSIDETDFSGQARISIQRRNSLNILYLQVSGNLSQPRSRHYGFTVPFFQWEDPAKALAVGPVVSSDHQDRVTS